MFPLTTGTVQNLQLSFSILPFHCTQRGVSRSRWNSDGRFFLLDSNQAARNSHAAKTFPATTVLLVIPQGNTTLKKVLFVRQVDV